MFKKLTAYARRISDKKVAIIQARMGSSRLPGKVLLPINKKPALKYLYDRIKKSKHLDDIIVATTESTKDDILVKFCIANNIKYYRGDENDVLGRVYKCAKSNNVDLVVEITADCPLVDPKIIDKCILAYYQTGGTYISNDIYDRSFADGFDVQVYNISTLYKAHAYVINQKHRNHVGWNIYKYKSVILPKIYEIYPVFGSKYFMPQLDLALDEKNDYVLINKIAEHFGDKNFTYYDVINYLIKNPKLLEINKNKVRKTAGEG